MAKWFADTTLLLNRALLWFVPAIMERTTTEALQAFEHAKESDDTIEDALENLREANATAEWDFESMPDVDVSDDEGEETRRFVDA